MTTESSVISSLPPSEKLSVLTDVWVEFGAVALGVVWVESTPATTGATADGLQSLREFNIGTS